MKTLTIAMIALCLSGSVLAMEGKVTLESGTASAKKNLHGKTITAEETAYTWNKYAQPPESSGSSSAIDWSRMPASSHCGINMVTQSTLRGYKDCQGHNPAKSCPSGFSRADLGYFEAGKGDRNFSTCVKN